MTGSTAATQERTRQIAHRTHGRLHGPIIRLMSPSDLGQSLKPFVFLDLFDDEGTSFRTIPMPQILCLSQYRSEDVIPKGCANAVVSRRKSMMALVMLEQW